MRHTSLVPELPDVEVICCSPLMHQPLSAGDAQELAATLKAIADPARLRLLSMISAHVDGEACVCDLTAPLGLSQPTVSHHLKVLLDAGLVTRSRRGTWAYYRTVPERLTSLAAVLSAHEPAALAPVRTS
jgi:ArsR family transcriptional regulator